MQRIIFLNSHPIQYFAPLYQKMAKDAAGATVIDLGQQDVTVSISVKWAIN